MRTQNILQKLAACLLCAAACSDDGGTTDGLATTTSATNGSVTNATGGGSTAPTTGDPCTPGYESCECVGGDVCLAGLTCVSKICVDLGELTTSGTGDDSAGKDTTGGELPPPSGTCTWSTECNDWEVCVEGYCGDTDLYWFDVRVVWFAPELCTDGWGEGEVYFAFFTDFDEVLQAVSPWQYCPADWSDFEMPRYDSLSSFRLDFWESDAFEDDYLTTLCWDAGGWTGTPCAPVPKLYLHDGVVTGYIGPNFEYEYMVTFTPHALP